jgi:hypothetical protein
MAHAFATYRNFESFMAGGYTDAHGSDVALDPMDINRAIEDMKSGLAARGIKRRLLQDDLSGAEALGLIQRLIDLGGLDTLR